MQRFTLLLLAALLTLPVVAQQPPAASETIDVDAVLIDAVVTDSKGNQILGLTKDDFVVRENGVVQQIDSVDYFTNRQLLDTREENAPFKVERVREERYFVLFFDRPEAGVLADQLIRARETVRRFFREQLKPGDLVAVAGHDNRLKIYSDFTADIRQLERALDSASTFGPGLTKAGAVTAGAPSILGTIDLDAMMNGTGTVYEALDVLADSLRSVRARKATMLFSAGIADITEDVRGEMLVNRSHRVEPMLRSLNAANVTVYPMQLMRDIDSTFYYHQRLGEIADATGGRYFRFNNSFETPLRQIERTNSGYYLITYRSKHPRGESGFQKVDVSVSAPELRVVARAGYTFGE